MSKGEASTSNDPAHTPFSIDKNHFKSPPVANPISGAALRALPPGVTSEYDLWLRARGHEDDQIIEDGAEVHLEPGMHFYTAKSEITPGNKM